MHVAGRPTNWRGKGTPVPADAHIEALGQLAVSESLLLLERRDRPFARY